MEPELEHLRLIEALLFASAQPIEEETLAGRLPEGVNVSRVMAELQRTYEVRGINLVKRGTAWAFRTAPDLAHHLRTEADVARRLSRAAIETLAIIAYHQPVTRAEIEEVRGVALSKGTLDTLFAAGWIRPKGRRRTPGRPLTWATTQGFLDHFGLESLDDLPGIEELKATGLLDLRPSAYSNRALDQGPLVDTEEEGEDGEDLEDMLAAHLEEEGEDEE